VLPGLRDRYYYGRRANGLYMPRFRNLKGRDADADFDRGYVMQGGSARMGWTDQAGDGDDFGAAYKQRLAGLGPWVLYVGGACEVLPRAANRITLDAVAKDRYGLPQLRFDVRRSDNEDKMAQDAMNQAEAMLAAAGAQGIRKMRVASTPGLTIHVQGGARMGHDPMQSVLNARNQLHGVPNLYATDGSAMASAGSVNPSITFMALTARAVEHAAAQLKAGAA
jgi:choline dehydrogenase-like flavoprotein